MTSKVLLNNINADADSQPFISKGGVAVVTVVADSFGGGTVSVQMASKNDSLGPRWVTLTNGVFTVDSIVKLDYIPVGTLIRVTLSGSSGASNVFADINQ